MSGLAVATLVGALGALGYVAYGAELRFAGFGDSVRAPAASPSAPAATPGTAQEVGAAGPRTATQQVGEPAAVPAAAPTAEPVTLRRPPVLVPGDSGRKVR
ncbi:MAG TPA: hypothetical protein VFT84_14990, partial [Gemmatimonadales bacterium]|nr:hypothetical protein [Gemmatimonadales bacterium]